MRISYSGLNAFQTCPAKYKFQFIERIRVPKSKILVFGSLIHETLKFMHEPQMVPSTEEQVLEYFNKIWDPTITIYEDSTEEAAAFEQGVKILKNYYAKNYPAKFNIVDLETRFETPILENPDSEMHLITGIIDRIDKLDDGRFEIIDYKTSRKMPPQKTVDNDLQLSIYHLGLVSRWPSLQKKEVSTIKLSLYYLKHGEKLSTSRTSQQLEETKQRILDLIEKITREEKFNPRPNPLCPWCQYQPYCPLFKHKYIQEIDDEQIKKAISEYFELKEKGKKNSQRLTELQKIINQYCDEKRVERVFGETGYITRLPQTRASYDENKIRQILEPLNKWTEVLSLDSIKLKKAVESLPLESKKKIEEAKLKAKESKTLTVGYKNLEPKEM
ncbi:MAG TPA: PD-(D/E)XK nuclease family protein [Candidatus Portnoybacteria bacterium]|nr:PD-(D/E)XK nuclease family protein [Candidatus Portnoybacteria bacterium]